MLLHELLKYPDIELIVGLELDQAVVRDSFKHFFTQPHFDMFPKVQWWFGDAAKSLLLLPKEWYGTFDLVMVDLSETIMSMTVSEELDVLKALALLLNPQHGIFVKNERYLDELSDVFDHVIQIYLPNVPLLCDQDWVFGSFGIDFLHPNFEHLLGKYEIPTLHYRPRDDASNHYELIKAYAKNDVNVLSAFADSDSVEGEERGEINEEGKKFGILFSIEAEYSSAPEEASNQPAALKENLLESINDIGGLRFIKAVTSNVLDSPGPFSVIIILHEGYIMAKAWPEFRYCALDVMLWSRFDLIETTREALLRAVGVVDKSAASSYRVVVGGMYGTDTWREDLTTIGPKKANSLNCKETIDGSKSTTRLEEAKTLSYSQIAIQESLALLPVDSDEKDLVVVFCGLESEGECESLNALSAKNVKTIAIWSRPKGSSDEAIIDPINLEVGGSITLFGIQAFSFSVK